MKILGFAVALTVLFYSNALLSQTISISDSLKNYISTKKVEVGIAAKVLETNDTLTIDKNKHFPMQSVYKFHLALAVLSEVDKGNLSLTERYHINSNDIKPDTWSPLGKKYPKGDFEMALSEILMYSVYYSDNNACDILFKIVGGAKFVNKYIHSIGIDDIEIAASEYEMHSSWSVQFTNWTTPFEAVNLLEKFYENNIVSKSSFDLLVKYMTDNANTNSRILGKLPKGTVVAHKTGTSDRSPQGVQAAVNDIGVITLPNGNHLAIAVFVANSKEKNEVNDEIIAHISKMLWDYYTKPNTAK